MTTEKRDKRDGQKREKTPKTRPMPQGKELADWAETRPQPPPGDRGNRLPPDPPTDAAAPREAGTLEPEEA